MPIAGNGSLIPEQRDNQGQKGIAEQLHGVTAKVSESKLSNVVALLMPKYEFRR